MDQLNLKLYHPAIKGVLVELSGNEVKFHKKHLQTNLRLNGIVIPLLMQKEFRGKKIIFPRDPLFSKAFVQVYYPYCLREAGFIFSAD